MKTKQKMGHYGLHDINKQMVTQDQRVLQCVLPSLQFGLTATSLHLHSDIIEALCTLFCMHLYGS